MTEAEMKYLHVEAIVTHLSFEVLKWLMHCFLQIIFTDLRVLLSPELLNKWKLF